ALADDTGGEVAFSPDGRALAYGDLDGLVRLADLDTGRVSPLVNLEWSIRSLAFTNDGRRLACACFDTISIWDLVAAKEVRRIGWLVRSADEVSFDGTGEVLAVLNTVADRRLTFYQVATKERVKGWSAPEMTDESWLRFAPDGRTVLLGGEYG